MKTIYEPHPVTPDRKEFLRREGYKILDSQFAPKGYVYPEAMRQKSADGAKGDQGGSSESREFLLDEIERLTEKRPGANTKDETLEKQYAELTKDQE